jgi:hypothetical protein
VSLKISNTFSLPLDFVTSTQAILAKKGSGKSYTASVQAEELLTAHQQIIAIDPTGSWSGLRTSADGRAPGFPIAVLGGEHGDVALEPLAGEVIADAIAADHFSAIIDLSLFRKGEALRFMATFLETLYRKNREALHVFIDEADVVAPQKTFGPDEARVLGATEDIVRRGRIRGIGCTLITQRPQVLNKNVLSQVDMLTALRMNHPKDLGAIREWVAVHGDEAQAKRMLADLPALPIGDAWVWAPASDIFERVTIRRRTTFDSGRTPKAGERRVAPRVLAAVDIAKLGATIAATVQRVKESDPKALKARVAELERQLAERVPDVVVPPIDLAPINALADKLIDLYRTFSGAAGVMGAELANDIQSLKSTLSNALRAAGKPTITVEPEPAKHRAPLVLDREKFLGTTERQVRPPAQARLLAAIRMLERFDIPRTRETVAAWYGQHPNTKGLANLLGTLRTAGLLDGLELTEAGRNNAKFTTPNREEALAQVLADLTPAQRRIVEVVRSKRRVGRTELAAALGVHENTKSLANDLGALRARAIVSKGWPAMPGLALGGSL